MSEAIKVQAGHKYHNQMKDPGDGNHLWSIITIYRLEDPATAIRGPMMLDTENLLTIEGPLCFKCEEPYSAYLANRRCKGSMEEVMP